MGDFDEAIYEIRDINARVDKLYHGMLTMTPQPRLQYFILHICDHCNLNCAGCNHLSTLAKPRFVDREVIKRDMLQLYKVHGDVPRIGIMGGEPLLHPEIKEILKEARCIFKKSELLLSTNGVLCEHMGNDFWDICKELDITVRFTRYPIKVNYDELVEKLRKRNISTDFFESTTDDMSEFQSIALDIAGKCNPVESFFGCIFANRCAVVADGKMYPCPIVQNAHFISESFGYQMDLEDKDYIDIFQRDEEETLRFLSHPIPFCRYCDVKKREELALAWRVSGKNPYEWCNFTFNENDIRFLKDKSVYVYGAGNWGRIALRTLNKRGVTVKSFVVSEMRDNKSDIDGVAVIPVEDISFDKDAFCIIAVSSKSERTYIQRKLIEKGLMSFALLSEVPN